MRKLKLKLSLAELCYTIQMQKKNYKKKNNVWGSSQSNVFWYINQQ